MVETVAQISKKQQTWTTELKRNAKAFISHPNTPYYVGAGAIGAALGTLVSASKHLDFFQSRKSDVEDLGKKIKDQQGRADNPTDPSNGGVGLEIGEESTLSRWMHYLSGEQKTSNLSGADVSNASFPLVEQEEGWLTPAQPYAPYIATAIAVVCLYGIYRCARNGLPNIPRPGLPGIPNLNPRSYLPSMPSMPRPDLGRLCRRREGQDGSDNKSTSTPTEKELSSTSVGSKDGSKTQSDASLTGAPSSVSGVVDPDKIKHSQTEEVKVEKKSWSLGGFNIFRYFRKTDTQVVIEKEGETKPQDKASESQEGGSKEKQVKEVKPQDSVARDDEASKSQEGNSKEKQVKETKHRDSSVHSSVVEDDKKSTRSDDPSKGENKSSKQRTITETEEEFITRHSKAHEEKPTVPLLRKSSSNVDVRVPAKGSSDTDWISTWNPNPESAGFPRRVREDSSDEDSQESPRPSAYGAGIETSGSVSEVYDPNSGFTPESSGSMDGKSSPLSSAELKAPEDSSVNQTLLIPPSDSESQERLTETNTPPTSEPQSQGWGIPNLVPTFLRSNPTPPSNP